MVSTIGGPPVGQVSARDEMPVLRDARGKLLPGTAAIRGRKHAHKQYLRKLLGEHGEKAYDGILAIAEGRTRIRRLVRDPRPDEDAHSAALIPTVEVVPSIRERLESWQFLAEQLNGKSTVGVDLDLPSSVDPALPNYDGFNDAQLAQLETLLQAASEGVRRLDASRDVVDGELVDDDET